MKNLEMGQIFQVGTYLMGIYSARKATVDASCGGIVSVSFEDTILRKLEITVCLHRSQLLLRKTLYISKIYNYLSNKYKMSINKKRLISTMVVKMCGSDLFRMYLPMLNNIFIA